MGLKLSNGKLLFRNGKLSLCCCPVGSGSGSGAGSACCLTEFGPFWIDGAVSPLWPASVQVSIPGACCSALHGPFTLVAGDPSILGPTQTVWYKYATASPTTCTGAPSPFGAAFDLICDHFAGPNQWSFRMFADQEVFAASVLSISCQPFHLIAQGITISNIFQPQWCSGTFDAEITE